MTGAIAIPINVHLLLNPLCVVAQVNIAVPWSDPEELPEGALDRLQENLRRRCGQRLNLPPMSVGSVDVSPVYH